MNNNLYFLEYMVREYQRERLAEAEKMKIISELKRKSPGIRSRILLKFGKFLISAGQKLIDRYRPATANNCQA